MGLGWFDDDYSREQTYKEYQYIPKDEAHLSHGAIARAAAYEAARAYEDHVEENGKPASHAKAKELLNGFADASVDSETHNLDFIDKEKVKALARRQCAEDLYKYGGYN